MPRTLSTTRIWVVPARWWLGAVLAALFHEISHFAAIYLTGGRLIGISIGVVGAKMEIMHMSRGREALCALAGPVGSLLLALGFSFFPEMALCALVQGLYNLIPVYPLDGGRVVRNLLQILVKKGKQSSVMTGIEATSMLIMVILSLYCVIVLQLGYLPLIFVSILFYRVFQRKLSCKEVQLAVQ